MEIKIDDLITKLTTTRTFKLTIPEITTIINLSKSILKPLPNLISISAPVTICGDIHGQYEDLLTLFKVTGYPPYTQFLFLGDYVDRGYASLETILLLLLLKIKYPSKVHLLRGNHESRLITPIYGFYDECLKKTNSILTWKNFMELFDLLPLCANIDGKIITMHGGLGPGIKKLSDIEVLDRNKEIPHDGPMSDICWSDPIVSYIENSNNTEDSEEKIKEEKLEEDKNKINIEISSNSKNNGYQPSSRGAGVMFGPDITDSFLRENGLELIARAHQIVADGYQWSHENKLITIFSAPNYCYRCGNKAGIMELGGNHDKILKSFEETDRLEGEERNMEQYQKPDYFL